MGKYFGTDGIRNVAQKLIAENLDIRMSASLSRILKEKINDRKIKVLIGKDTRISGSTLETRIASKLLENGIDVHLVNVISTPAVAYITKIFDFDASVMISASHNTYEYNGLKIFSHNGYKLSDEDENQIELLMDDENILNIENRLDNNLGNLTYSNDEYINTYINHLEELSTFTKKKYNISLDTANGSDYIIAKTLFDKLGNKVYVTANTPDGININDNCGSTHEKSIQNEVIKNHTDIGFAFDGDGDRLITADENGNIVDGDVAMAIIGKYLKDNNKLAKNTVVITVMSNIGLKKYLNENNINITETKVGDRYVLENMLENGYVFGGEQSGHLISLNNNSTGDGMQSAILLLNAMDFYGKKLSELAKDVEIFPQVLINQRIDMNRKNEYNKIDEINNKIKEIECKLNDQGRVLIRVSGTEPVIRVMIEGKDLNEINEYALSLVELYKKHLGEK